MLGKHVNFENAVLSVIAAAYFYVFYFNKNNKERVALKGHLIHSLHGPAPRHSALAHPFIQRMTAPLAHPFWFEATTRGWDFSSN